MARWTLGIAVELDSGDKIRVIADQRDLAAVEAREDVDRQFTRIRFIAWHAAKRAGQYTGTWERWNSTDCVEAGDEDEAESGEGLDPGRPEQSAGN